MTGQQPNQFVIDKGLDAPCQDAAVKRPVAEDAVIFLKKRFNLKYLFKREWDIEGNKPDQIFGCFAVAYF